MLQKEMANREKVDRRDYGGIEVQMQVTIIVIVHTYFERANMIRAIPTIP